MTPTDMLVIARGLVSRGYSVIPLDHPDDPKATDPDQIGKTPIIKWKAYQDRLPTDAELVEWFGNGRQRNAAIVTGAISNVIMVDGDSAEGLAWMRAHLPLSPLRTGTAKGEHWGYRHPGVVVKNKVRIRTGDPAIKIDVRGDGGYVVAPGSLHRTRVTYQPLDYWPPVHDLPMFDPAWLEPEPEPEPEPERPKTVPPSIPHGTRHDTLWREGCRLRQRGYGEAEIADTLWSLHTHRSKGPEVPRENIDKIAKDICGRYEAGSGDRVVVMRGGDLTAIVDRAEEALRATAIYQRGGLLTRVITLDTPLGGAQEVRRDAGSTMLIAVREPWLVEQMGRVLTWQKVNAKREKLPADPSPLYARTLLSRSEWTFPVLRSVVTAPTLARDGRIIEVPGLDEASGLLLDFAVDHFAPVPHAPSKADAHEALARLSHPLRKFPFVDNAATAVALSALLTALVRPSLRTAPLHSFDAPTAGTGKSLLAEMAGLLATGVKPPALSQGKTPEEDEKRLATVLFAGDPVIHLDNCEEPISGDFLCSMLTQEVVQARILGLSERRILPCTALVCASGNNLTHAGDASRRAVICRLDAQLERPDTRVFDFDCHAEVRADRPRLVIDGLTILRAYHVAGRPVSLTPMGSFDDYEWIRGALVWLGCADPADTRISILDADPRKDELITVMELWERACGETPVEVASIPRQADAVIAEVKDTDTAAIKDAINAARARRDMMRALRDRLIEVACKSGWSSKSVGWWLRRNKDRVVNERCFRHAGGRLWALALPTAKVASEM